MGEVNADVKWKRKKKKKGGDYSSLLFSVKLCHFRPNFQLIINQVEKFYLR